MNVGSAAVNAVWGATSLPAWTRFRRALRTPEVAQERVLLSCLRRNADTVFGRAHAFGSIRSVADTRRRVAPTSYDEMAPLVHRVAGGEPSVLTRTAVERLVPSSGSTAAVKLIPFTADLRAEFTTAIDAWLVEISSDNPRSLADRRHGRSPRAQQFNPRRAARPFPSDSTTTAATSVAHDRPWPALSSPYRTSSRGS